MNKITILVYFILKSQSDLLCQFTQVMDGFLKVLLLCWKREMTIKRCYSMQQLCCYLILHYAQGCLPIPVPPLSGYITLLPNQSQRPLSRKPFLVDTSNALFICNIKCFSSGTGMLKWRENWIIT